MRQVPVLLLYFVISGGCVELVVQTGLGEVRGLRSDEGEYTMFLGVPYALVDEDNPFGAPIPHPDYSEPVLAYKDDTVCPQKSATGSKLQCLVVNIYVPDTTEDFLLLPVLVWVHGGAWVVGNGNRINSNPNFLVRNGVIVVTVNYRLGMYGFMCTDSPKAPGNTGLRDQLLAFRWIKEHISSFGGDPDKITAVGESAGGMSIHLHILSHHEKLFERAIIQSGSSSSPWAGVDKNNEVPIKIAIALGFETDALEDAIDFLAKANVDDVVEAAVKLNITSANNGNQPETKPCVEKEFESIERFVSVHPNVAHSNKVKDIDIIIGYNSDEMIIEYGNRSSEFFDTYSFKDLLKYGFNKVTGMANMEMILKNFYVGDEDTSKVFEKEIIHYASDLIWNHPTERAIKLLLEDNARVIYQYLFSYEGGRNFNKYNLNTTVPGAAHGDELGYIFDVARFKTQEHTVPDLKIIDQITTMWTNFVKYGNPTPEITELLPVKWEPVTAARRPYLNIGKELASGRQPFHDRMAFFDLFYEANRDKAKGFTDIMIQGV